MTIVSGQFQQEQQNNNFEFRGVQNFESNSFPNTAENNANFEQPQNFQRDSYQPEHVDFRAPQTQNQFQSENSPPNNAEEINNTSAEEDEDAEYQPPLVNSENSEATPAGYDYQRPSNEESREVEEDSIQSPSLTSLRSVYAVPLQTQFAPAQYEFSYGVHDPLTGDIKSHSETRQGDSVRGVYSVQDPDGYKRTVLYTADGEQGFNAVVKREPVGVRVVDSYLKK